MITWHDKLIILRKDIIETGDGLYIFHIPSPEFWIRKYSFWHVLTNLTKPKTENNS